MTHCLHRQHHNCAKWQARPSNRVGEPAVIAKNVLGARTDLELRSILNAHIGKTVSHGFPEPFRLSARPPAALTCRAFMRAGVCGLWLGFLSPLQDDAATLLGRQPHGAYVAARGKCCSSARDNADLLKACTSSDRRCLLCTDRTAFSDPRQHLPAAPRRPVRCCHSRLHAGRVRGALKCCYDTRMFDF